MEAPPAVYDNGDGSWTAAGLVTPYPEKDWNAIKDGSGKPNGLPDLHRRHILGLRSVYVSDEAGTVHHGTDMAAVGQYLIGGIALAVILAVIGLVTAFIVTVT
jgi:hypothetical protein